MEKEINRKIAVVFVTDVVGFSTSMEVDENQTLQSFRACKRILEDLFSEHGGRIFNTAGDSILAEFSSAVSAVICASEFQKLIQERNSSSSLPENGKMEFRVGLNMGDVIVEGENLYGEGVNVASRLEALSQPNGVSLSKSIYDFVNKKTDFLFDDLGEQKIKNTNVHAFDIITSPEMKRRGSAGLGEKKDTSEKASSNPPAIAVLPFLNMSGDVEQEYFADGITEDIISNLSSWKTFPVISRNSSFSYKGTSVRASQIAADLNVDYIVEGSVRKGGSKVRITAQLIDASSDKQLWSKRWDKSLDDVFEVQDEVSASIAAMVSPAVKGQEQVKLSSKKKVDSTAWDYYLRALAIYNNENRATAFTDSDKVIDMCEKSISMQSDLSDPYVLACKAILNNIYNLDKATDRPQNEVKYHKYCQKAYDLDNNNPEAVVALSRSYNLKRDYEKRLELAEKALELNPHHSGALFDYALAITSFGRFEEAMKCIERSIELNPVEKKSIDYMVVMTLIGLKQFDKTIELIDEMARDGRGGVGQIGFKVACLAHLGELDKAKNLLVEYLAQRPQVKNLNDYAKVAPTIIKDILMEGMRKSGLPET
ncbi:MAG: adenylate/guanylate cyclase domain-containing protein [Paracoccaceae bacterium]